MKTFHCFLTEIKKYTINHWFAISVMAAYVLSFFSVVYEDPFVGKTYTVWEIMTKFSKSDIVNISEELSAYNVFFKSFNDAQSMLYPILVSLPFSIPLALERKTGNLRFSIIRCGIRSYCIGNLLAAMITGGLIMALSSILFGLSEYLFFPALSNWGHMVNFNDILAIFQRLAGLFMVGCTGTLAAYLLSFFTTNYYLIICIPFLLEFLAERISNWAFEHFLFSQGIYDNWFACILPSALYSAPNLSSTGLIALGIYLLLTLIIAVLCITIMERRVDCAC